MKRAYILYNKRTCATGRELFEALKENKTGGLNWRHACSAPPRVESSIIIRWGNSLYDGKGSNIEINNKDSVKKATDKFRMASILSEADGVNFPRIFHQLNGQNAFIRDQYDHVRYGNNMRATDKYATEEIDKRREFRVHVFRDTIIGVYEKIPNEDNNDNIWKDHNCTFRRVDLADRNNRVSIKGVRPSAKAAVKALGLDFGGVDVIVDGNGKVWVLEVNSAPGLNDPNIDRWVNCFGKLISDYGKGEDAQLARNERDQAE